MKISSFFLVLCAAFALTPALAQQHSNAHAHADGQAQQGQDHDSRGVSHRPYSGMQQREIKALSAQQLADLRAGKGMGLAMAAELNGYPGPMHVLELASELDLSAGQREQTERLFAQVRAQAKAQGEQVIEAERALDALFAQKQATPEALASAVAAAAAAHGKLRETHLRHHLSMMAVLSPEQIRKYQQLRGY